MDLTTRMLMMAASEEKDPHWANVSLLLKGVGANGATTLVDSSSSPKSLALRVGAPIISTAQAKFGSSSIWLPTGTNYWQGTGQSGLSLGAGNFTFEFFVYPTTTVLYACLFDTRTPGGGATTGVAIEGNGRTIETSGGTDVTGTGSPTVALNTWAHVAHVRSANVIKTYINGVASATSSSNSDNMNGSALTVGHYGDSTNWSPGCYVQEVRVTLGVARYTADFTPPGSPFPTS